VASSSDDRFSPGGLENKGFVVGFWHDGKKRIGFLGSKNRFFLAAAKRLEGLLQCDLNFLILLFGGVIETGGLAEAREPPS